MPLSSRVRSFFRNIVSPERGEAALDRELEAYLELLIDEGAVDGATRDDVRRRLLAEMGGKESVKEKVRERRVGAFADALLRDVTFAWRLFWRNPGFSFLVVGTLALGIAVTTAVFSVVSGVLLRRLPYPSPDRLVLLSATTREGRRHFSPPDYVDLVGAVGSFDALAAIQGAGYVTLSVDGEPGAVRAREVTEEFLSVYGLAPHLGRSFDASDRASVAFESLGEDAESLPPGVIMLGYEFWQERFGGDPGVVGELVELEYQPYRIVGVTPPGFRALLPDEGDYRSLVDLWTLSRMPFESMPRDAAFLRVLGRLRPGVAITRANAEAALFAARQRSRFPDHAAAGFEVHVLGLGETINARHQTTIWVLFGAALLLMGIACANLINLLLTRALGRRKELVVRMALGSGRARIVRQLASESLLYALFAAAIALPLASDLIRLFASLAPPSIPRIAEIRVDGSTVVFALAGSLIASMVVAVLPAASISQAKEIGMLKGVGRTLTGAERDAWRHVLVIAEIALSVVLVVGTALFLRTLVGLLAVDPGFTATSVLTAEMNLPSQRYPRYPRADERVRFARRLTERLEDLPGVNGAALALVVPLSRQDAGHSYASEDMAAAAPILPPAKYRPITPGYFDVVDTQLIGGRSFTWEEVEQYRLVSIVDERLAAKAWPGQDALGKRLRIERWATAGGPIHLEPLWTEVVGVARNVRSGMLQEEDIETVYLPYGLYAVSELSLLVRTATDPESIVDSVRAVVAQVDPDLAVFNYREMGEFVTVAVAPERYSLGLLGAFGLAGLLIALVGVYGVLSHAVSLRSREFGLRMALGATTPEIGRMVLAGGARVIVSGVTLGLLAAVFLARYVASQLYGVRPTDPVTYVLVATLVVAVGLLASAVPTYRACKTDPMRALRFEQ
ncbi:MAG TPA: ABC transporter permease [Vicinamibacteria bacterium]|nr:ABC transporter permease [Vicinamibacteria bacterium]